MCRTFPRVPAVAVIGSSLCHAPASAGPITFNAAITLSSGEFVIREQAVLSQSGDDSSGAERERRTLAAVSVLAYGIGETLSLFAVLPYVDKRLEATAGGMRRVRQARGRTASPSATRPAPTSRFNIACGRASSRAACRPFSTASSRPN